MKLSTEDAKKLFFQILRDHSDELTAAFGSVDVCDASLWKRASKSTRNGVVSRKFSHRNDIFLSAYVYSDAADAEFTSVFVGRWSGCSHSPSKRYYFNDGEQKERAAREEGTKQFMEELKREEVVGNALDNNSNALASNPVKVRFTIQDRHAGLTGKIVFYPAESDYDGIVVGHAGFDEDCKDGFHFYCGPQDGDHLSDSASCYDSLHILFSDFGDRIDIGDAENYHSVRPIKGMKASEVWMIVRNRLLRSGAVEEREQEE